MIARTSLVFLVAALLIPATVEAQHIPSGFGLGVVVGEPTGLTARFRSGSNNFQTHAAWSFSNGGSLHLSGDYLRSGDIDTDPVIPFYFGLGARVKFDDKTQVGIRIPLGLNYLLRSEPIEFFGELVPIIDVAPSTDFKFNAAIGVRYYFGATGTGAPN